MIKGMIVKLIAISAGLLLIMSPLTFSQKGNPVVEMKTSKGIIIIELYPEKAPITVKNFLSYVNEDFYNGLCFHRVIKDFMIQAGDTCPI